MQKPIHFQNAAFLRSCYHYSDLPEDEGSEIIFLGRSNAGKSTLLNVLCKQNALARVSKTPGRTQCLNVFQCCSGARFIDAPGYGFAKVERAMMSDWQRVIAHYCMQRRSLKTMVLIMDCRHPLQQNDKDWLDLLANNTHKVRLIVVLGKADKLSKMQQNKQRVFVEGYLRAVSITAEVMVVSAKKGLGVVALTTRLLEAFASTLR